MKRTTILISLIVFIGTVFVSAQQSELSKYFPEFNILESNDPAAGYYFMGSRGLSADGARHYIAIVDNYGEPVFFRLVDDVTVGVRLLKNGEIGYAHGGPRKLYLMDDMLNVYDTINTVGGRMDGHDWEIADNLDYHRFLFTQYKRTLDMSTLVEGGSTEAEIGEFKLQEFDTANKLVNSFLTENIFNVLDGNDNSPYLDFTSSPIDYSHINGIALYSDSSYIISSRHMDEITNIDRRTGEIIWRLGGKNNQFTFINDSLRFSHQHTPRTLANGNILVFDNGNLHDSSFSSVVEYAIDEINMTATLVKRFRRDPDVFVARNGFSQRVHNGNTIAEWGGVSPSLTEFHPDGSIAFEFDISAHSYAPRIAKYMWETKVFESSEDSLDFGLFDGTNAIEMTIQLTSNCDTAMHITGISSRSGNFGTATVLPLELLPGIPSDLKLVFDPLESSEGYFRDMLTIYSENSEQRIARQVFVEAWQNDNTPPDLIFMPDSLNTPLSPLITITSSEALKRADGREIYHEDLDDLLIFRTGDENGNDIPFKAVINTARTKITLNPVDTLQYGTDYFIGIAEALSDYSGNQVTKTSQIFRTLSLVSSKDRILNELHIYPNPAAGKFRISMRNQNNVKVQIYSVSGSLVKNINYFNPRSDVVNIQGSESGIYFVVIRSEDDRIIGRAKVVIR